MSTNFSALDWVIVVFYLTGTVAIGLYVNRYIRTMSDFVVAGRALKTRLAIATMVGSELGLVTVMYSAQKGFTGGFAAFHIGLIAGVMTLLVGITGFIVVPLRRHRVMTIPEFYEIRYTRGVRVLGGFLLAFAGILNMGLFLKAGAVFVTELTGLSDPNAVNIVMTALIVLVLAYTILGGMVSVAITDYVQFVVLSVGLLLTCGLAVNQLGWSSIVETVEKIHGDGGFDPFDNDGFGWDYVLMMVFAGVASCALWQTAAVRACASESEQVVRRLYIWSSIGFMIRCMVPQFLGICALTYFWNGGDVVARFFTATGELVDPATSLAAMPAFLSQILPVGLIGIVGSGMLAAFMSTHDTYLLCWATALTEDVVNPLSGGRLGMRARLLLTRIFIVAIAFFLLLWGLWYPLGQDLWDYMFVTGSIYVSGAFAVVVAGLYWRGARPLGAYLALLAGAGAVFGLKPVKDAFGIEVSSAVITLGVNLNAIVLMIVGSMAQRAWESQKGAA